MLVCALAGCTTSTPTPAATVPSTAPTPVRSATIDPAAAAQKQNVDDARAALATFNDLTNSTAQAGYDAEPLSPMMTGELRPAVIVAYRDYAERKLKQTGTSTIDAVTMVKYEPGPAGAGKERVTLDACRDNSGIDVVTPDGKSAISDEGPDRFVVTYVAAHQEDDRWTFDSATPDRERAC
ncbi:hypothetical protein D1825_11245 [Cellulomonas rhizosphaerae]|uniref:Lipoprotein n=1 Tax=Cellulomonas rhizosphaerae TaxID=2293719 RepID=A0A413RKK3_9CELL|nr:hypothetical protein D1825_11245 [Cellulomonas rhizosphaerae]